MIDLRRLRDDAEYRAGIERKRVRAGLLDDVLATDEERRRLQSEVQELRARQNAASKEIGKASPDDRPCTSSLAISFGGRPSPDHHPCTRFTNRPRRVGRQPR